MNRLFYIAFVLISGFISALNTYACRYTVREIGFSDIGSIPYLIYIYTNSDVPEDDITTVQNMSSVLLHESNISLKIINVDEEKDSITQYHLDKFYIKTFPTALFVAPLGESVICSMDYPGRSLDESIWLFLENLVSSGIRKSITEQLLQSYSVVLVIEGTKRSENNKALREANEAVMEITGIMDQMPKVVNSPPVILVVPHEKIQKEKILLMSLGIKEGSIEPYIAIIYGRGRVLGPVLKGEQITQRTLFNFLAIVGADCECGLDQSWILGRMIPLRWESSVQSELARFLGFDVESPLVKAEMSQILSVKPPPDNLLDPLRGNLLGYAEGELNIENNPNKVSKISASQVRKSFYQEETSGNNLVFKIILIGFGGILFIVLVTLLVILYKRRKILH